MTNTTTTPDLLGTLRRAEHDLLARRSREVRGAKAAGLRSIRAQSPRAGAAVVAAALRDMPDWARIAKVGQLLSAINKVGQARARTMALAGRALPTDRLWQLDGEQREAIAQQVDAFAARVKDLPHRGGPGSGDETQRNQALAKRNDIRLARQAALQVVRAHATFRDGMHAAADLIETGTDERLDQVAIADIIAQVHQVGRPTARRIVLDLGLTATTTLSLLSGPRRAAIAEAVRRRGNRPLRRALLPTDGPLPITSLVDRWADAAPARTTLSAAAA